MSKYKAEKIVIDGYKFDSKIEMKYYEYLKELKAKGQILNFELQPEYILQKAFKDNFGNHIRAIKYKADYLIYHLNGTTEVIDIKGLATAEAKLKRKMFWNIYKNEILTWLVWYQGKWMDYDEVQKIRRNKRKCK